MKRRLTYYLLMWTALLGFILPEATAQERINFLPSSQYQIFDEVMETTSGKTKSALRIMVSGDLSKPSLTRLFKRIGSTIRERVEFQTQTPLSHLIIWAYISKIHLHSKELWLARWEEKEKDVPQIRFNDAQLEQLHAPPEQRLGLSEEIRIQIWQELQVIQKKSRLEALIRFPLNPSQLSQAGQFFRLTKRTILLLAEAGALDPPAIMTGAVSLVPQTTITLLHSITFQNRLWHYVEATPPLAENPTMGWIDSLTLIRQPQTPDQEYYDQIQTLTRGIEFGYRFELMEKHRLSSLQLKEIMLEGIFKNWPLSPTRKKAPSDQVSLRSN